MIKRKQINTFHKLWFDENIIYTYSAQRECTWYCPNKNHQIESRASERTPKIDFLRQKLGFADGSLPIVRT